MNGKKKIVNWILIKGEKEVALNQKTLKTFFDSLRTKGFGNIEAKVKQSLNVMAKIKPSRLAEPMQCRSRYERKKIIFQTLVLQSNISSKGSDLGL